MESRNFDPELTSAIFAVYGGMCFYCAIEGRQEKATSLDHIIPDRKGGKAVPENLLPACSRCNHTKSDKDLTPEILAAALESAKASAPAVAYIRSTTKANKDRASKVVSSKPRRDGFITKIMRMTPSEWDKIEQAIIHHPDKFHTRLSENKWFIQACLEKASRDMSDES